MKACTLPTPEEAWSATVARLREWHEVPFVLTADPAWARDLPGPFLLQGRAVLFRLPGLGRLFLEALIWRASFPFGLEQKLLHL